MYIVESTQEFREWLRSLRDRRAKARIIKRLQRAETGSLGEWRPIAGVASEMKIDEGAGYRLYFARRQRTIIIMLAGGNKSSQEIDIARALLATSELEL